MGTLLSIGYMYFYELNSNKLVNLAAPQPWHSFHFFLITGTLEMKKLEVIRNLPNTSMNIKKKIQNYNFNLYFYFSKLAKTVFDLKNSLTSF